MTKNFKESLLRVKNLEFKFSIDSEPFFSNLNFDVYKNESIVIFGNNGSGKSTLSKIMVGLYMPYSGNIEILNDTKITMMLQNPDYALIGQTVKEELIFSLENLNIPRKEMKIKLDLIINKFNLSNLLDTKIQNLSGGLKQKISLISILISNPDLVILDEPTNLLDQIEIKKFNSLISDLKKEEKTIVIVSHKINDIFNADRVFYLDNNHNLKIFSKSDFLIYFLETNNLNKKIETSNLMKFNKIFNLNLSNNLDESLIELLQKNKNNE